ncbi:MAG: hypothetical protein R3Y63_02270 [Eubacteriales bacterium]
MSLFCSNCGTKVEQAGACPNCQQMIGSAPTAPQGGYAPAPQAAAPAANAVNADSLKSSMKDSVPFAKEYVATPSVATRTVVDNENIPLAVVLFAFFAITHVLTFFLSYSKTCEYFNDMASIDMSVSIVSVILAGLMYAVAIVLLTVGCNYVACHLCNGSADFKEILMAVCVNTIPLTLCQAAVFVFLFLGLVKFAFYVFAFQFVLWILLLILIPVEVFECRYSSVACVAMVACIIVANLAYNKVALESNVYILENIDADGNEYYIKQMTSTLDDVSMSEVMDEMFDSLEEIFG